MVEIKKAHNKFHSKLFIMTQYMVQLQIINFYVKNFPQKS